MYQHLDEVAFRVADNLNEVLPLGGEVPLYAVHGVAATLVSSHRPAVGGIDVDGERCGFGVMRLQHEMAAIGVRVEGVLPAGTAACRAIAPANFRHCATLPDLREIKDVKGGKAETVATAAVRVPVDVAEGERFVGSVNLRRSENLQVGVSVLARAAAVNQQGVVVQAVSPLRGVNPHSERLLWNVYARYFGNAVTVAVQGLVVLQVEFRCGAEGGCRASHHQELPVSEGAAVHDIVCRDAVKTDGQQPVGGAALSLVEPEAVVAPDADDAS